LAFVLIFKVIMNKVIESKTLEGLFSSEICSRLLILVFVNDITDVEIEIFGHLMLLKVFFVGPFLRQSRVVFWISKVN